jgi:hypothetical protein
MPKLQPKAEVISKGREAQAFGLHVFYKTSLGMERLRLIYYSELKQLFRSSVPNGGIYGDWSAT